MRNKLLLLGGILGIGTTSFAQLPVSTTAENKNVVLEEYTGIHCVYCPDGHLKASQLATANPGDVVLINIHAGSYATPGAGEPDFRVPFGVTINNAAGIAGYPAGSINRRVFTAYSQNGAGGMAMSRGNWTAAAGVVLAEPSYVNVALEGDLDLATDTLTVDVEIYFTGSTAPASVNLNVALLQNNIAGPQTGGSTYNPGQILPNGDYNHQHMLRDLLTGQWGEVVTTTSMGTLITKTYKYKLPAEITNVPLSPGDIEIAAFVAEGNNNIVTGAKGPVTYTAPAGSVIADLAASTAMTFPADYCATSVTPEITVTNNSTTDPASNFEVSYSLNGAAPVTQNVTTAVAAGGSTTVSFPAVNLTTGTNTISYEVSTAGNATLFDLSSGNNMAGSGDIYTIPSTPFATGHAEDFESATVNTGSVDNTILLNPDNSLVVVINKSLVNGLAYDIGGFGNSENSFFWYFYNMQSGTEASLTYEKLDFSNATGNELTFSRAYCQYASENDKLEVNVSTDCGATWTNVYSKSGTALSTKAAQTGSFWPKATEWATDVVDLSAYDNTADVMIQFRGVSAYGNNLFIDDIKIENSTYVGVDEQALNAALTVYPNPANDQVNISLGADAAASVTISVLDATGKRVMEVISDDFAANHVETLNVSSLKAGVYILQVNADGNVKQQKLIIE